MLFKKLSKIEVKFYVKSLCQESSAGMFTVPAVRIKVEG